jgi:TRAP-type mannitol/chloroaromatic compound transport system permease small subunit
VLPFCGLLIYLGYELFWRAWISGEMSHNAGGLIRWPVYLTMPIGFALLFLQVVSETIKRGAWLAGHRAQAHDSEADLPPLRIGGATPQEAGR